MSQSMSLNAQHRYEIQLSGQLDPAWLHWFGQARASSERLANNSQVTVFADVIMDQAELVGLIRKLHGLGIVLVSIRQL